MNAIPKPPEPADHPLDAIAAELASSDARRRSLQRTWQALFRERLLNRDQLIMEGAVSWLPLWAPQGMLRFEGLTIGSIGDCRLAGSVSYYATGERKTRSRAACSAPTSAPAMFWTVALLYAVAAVGMRAIRSTRYQPIQAI